MNISDAGLEMIKKFEGCRYVAYQDSVGIWTIGYGHTNGVAEGDVCTPDEADAYLRADLSAAEKCVNNSVKVALTQGQYDALVSFVYNLGCGTLRASSILPKINSGDDVGAAQIILRYNHAGGKVLAGLTTRRSAEMEMFLS